MYACGGVGKVSYYCNSSFFIIKVAMKFTIIFGLTRTKEKQSTIHI